MQSNQSRRDEVMKNSYIENPKTKGSGIMCCIPQKGVCPVGCADCFFQSGRSYLEPLDKNLPNMPSLKQAKGQIIRVNDGNDSSNRQEEVMAAVKKYPQKFYNTSMPWDLDKFDAPVVLTANPGKMTDCKAELIDPIPENLMFVRVRTNTWNLRLVDRAIEYYTAKDIPVVLTFMAYYSTGVRKGHENDYTYRKRTMNSYWVITAETWNRVMDRYKDNRLVYACGKDADTFACSRCGNCLREYYATMEKMKALSK